MKPFYSGEKLSKKKKFVRKVYFLAWGLLVSLMISSVAFGTVSQASYKSSERKQVSSRWKYIVIHHSATRQGNAKYFDSYHRRRGMRNGLAYHFVINNGTSGREQGELEIGSRWKKQLNGGHCKQDWINNSGIGICLVGNFNKDKVSKEQFNTLFELCKLLIERYNIPVKNIMGHGHVRGEHSACPGKYFPLKELKKELIGYEKSKGSGIP